jgi:hypothetical protein
MLHLFLNLAPAIGQLVDDLELEAATVRRGDCEHQTHSSNSTITTITTSTSTANAETVATALRVQEGA